MHKIIYSVIIEYQCLTLLIYNESLFDYVKRQERRFVHKSDIISFVPYFISFKALPIKILKLEFYIYI